MKKITSRPIAMGGMLTALALIFSYIEFLIPISIGIPGIKLGFANIVIVYALYKLGAKEAFLVNLCRVVLAGLMFGSVFSTLYALSGALVSFAGMALLRKTRLFSTAGVSMAGGVLHNLGQIMVAALVVQTAQVLLYFPILIFAGILTGAINGIVASICLEKTQKL